MKIILPPLSSRFQALSILNSPEERIAALCKKYSDLVDEHNLLKQSLQSATAKYKKVLFHLSSQLTLSFVASTRQLRAGPDFDRFHEEKRKGHSDNQRVTEPLTRAAGSKSQNQSRSHQKDERRRRPEKASNREVSELARINFKTIR